MCLRLHRPHTPLLKVKQLLDPLLREARGCAQLLDTGLQLLSPSDRRLSTPQLSPFLLEWNWDSGMQKEGGQHSAGITLHRSICTLLQITHHDAIYVRFGNVVCAKLSTLLKQTAQCIRNKMLPRFCDPWVGARCMSHLVLRSSVQYPDAECCRFAIGGCGCL